MKKRIPDFIRIALPVLAVMLGLSSLVSAAEPNDPERAPTLPTQGRDPSPLRYAAGDDGKLRIIAFGAHPDDCERVENIAVDFREICSIIYCNSSKTHCN